MNWTIIIIETIIMTIAFTVMILIPWGMLIGLIPCLIGAGLYAWII